MRLVKWKQNENLNPISRYFNDDLDDFFNFDNYNNLKTFGMDLDVKETKKEYQIKANLPGMKKEDINISCDNGLLNISAQSNIDNERKNGKYHYRERFTGSYRRTLRLPENCETDNVKAKLKDGVLFLHIPKSKEAIETKIQIN